MFVLFTVNGFKVVLKNRIFKDDLKNYQRTFVHTYSYTNALIWSHLTKHVSIKKHLKSNRILKWRCENGLGCKSETFVCNFVWFNTNNSFVSCLKNYWIKHSSKVVHRLCSVFITQKSEDRNLPLLFLFPGLFFYLKH